MENVRKAMMRIKVGAGEAALYVLRKEGKTSFSKKNLSRKTIFDCHFNQRCLFNGTLFFKVIPIVILLPS